MKKERRNAIDMVNTEMMKDLTAIDPHDLWLLLYDNIGFKVLKGYEQYTAMQWVRIPKVS
jgi:bacterioferritin (cytochrome b1)